MMSDANRREYLMTNINYVIAKHKGWRRPTKDECAPDDGWINDFTRYTSNEIPDYLHDATLYMALFEEMKLCALLNYEGAYQVKVYDRKYSGVRELFSIAESPIIGGAICLAYCKLHGLECEG